MIENYREAKIFFNEIIELNFELIKLK